MLYKNLLRRLELIAGVIDNIVNGSHAIYVYLCVCVYAR